MQQHYRERGNTRSRKSLKPYQVLLSRAFLEHQIEVRWTGLSRVCSAEIETLIESAWQERLARDTSRSLYPGPLCRLVAFSVVGDVLRLELGPTDYRELLGTNVYHPEIAERFGQDYLSNALAVHATVVTADGQLLVFRRSSTVGEYPGAYDVCGGHLDPVVDMAQGAPSPFYALRRELKEEIGLSAEEMDSAVCLGLVRNAHTLKPDLIFDVRTKLAWADFKRRALDLTEEHDRAGHIGDSKTDITRFLSAHGGNVAPAGVAALELHASHVQRSRRRRTKGTWY